jgi:hypothetical protein
VTELALETAPRWPPDRPAIQGPSRIDFERADAPPAPCQMVPWAIDPASGLEGDETRTTQRLRSRRATEFLYPTGGTRGPPGSRLLAQNGC